MSANNSNDSNLPTPPTSPTLASLQSFLPTATHAVQTEWREVLVIFGYFTAIDILEYLHLHGTSTSVLMLASLFLLAVIWYSQIASFFLSLVTKINRSTTSHISKYNLPTLWTSTEEAARIKVSSPATIRTEEVTWKKAVRMLLLSIGLLVAWDLFSYNFRCNLKHSWTTVFRFAAHCNAIEIAVFPNKGWSITRSELCKQGLRIIFGWSVLDIMLVVLEYSVLCMTVGMEEARICFD